MPITRLATCQASVVTDCYEIREIVAGLSEVSALSAAPDGRLFFVEDHLRVRVVEDGRLVSEPALVLKDDLARIVGLAVDQLGFRETRSMFVAWSEATPRSSGRTLSVTRYRELANTLGEGATILTGVDVPPDLPVPIGVDADGLVYVAVPDANVDRVSQVGSGSVLRITRDGLVPPANLLGLPTFLSGLATPTSLAMDLAQRQLWVASGHGVGPYSIGLASTSPPRSSLSADVITQVAATEPISLVWLKGPGAENHAELLVIADGRLLRMRSTTDGSLAPATVVDLGEGMHVRAAAPGSDGALYVASKTSIFELIKR